MKISLLSFVILMRLSAQDATLAGCGYAMPAADAAPSDASCPAAPGQIFVLSLNGLTPDTASADIRYPTGGFIRLNGIALQLQQPDSDPVPARILFPIKPGTPLSLTVQIPYALDPSKPAALAILKDDVPAGSVRLRAASDAVHVMNSCDQTGFFLSILTAGPAAPAGCVWMVEGPRLLVLPNNPVHAGDTVAMWMFGLGPVADATPQGITAVAQPLQLNFDYKPNAEASANGGIAGAPAFAAGYNGTGLYQVNYTIPPVPDGVALAPCDGVQVISNLTVTLSGAASLDAAKICVQP